MNVEPNHMLSAEDGQDQTRSEAEIARQEALAAKLEAFGNVLCKKREEAINGRAASGIEQEWTEAEEAYQGIDDANRGSTSVGKPSSPNGGYVNGPASAKGTRSTVFLNITRPYVDTASARVGDMLLPTDDTPWSIKPSPLPDNLKKLIKAPVATPPVQGMLPGQELMPAQAAPELGPLAAKIKAAYDQAKASADAATKQIEDWFVECQWHAEVRKMIEDCSRLGTGILKGPFPVKRTHRASSMDGGMMKLVIKESLSPASRAISPWKFYPDPGCGENICDGSYVWENDSITTRALRDLKGVTGYISDQIDKVIAEGPGAKHREAGLQYGKVAVSDTDNFDIWYFYGVAERDDLVAAGVDVPAEGDVSVPAIVTMVNNTVIRAALNPLDSGDFPYDVMPWQRRTGMPWGTGVAKQISTPQRMLNAATRNMMDNAGLSAGPQIVIRKGVIQPADGTWSLTPRKIWYAKEGADVNAVQQAFMAVNIQSLQGDLNNIIQFALKMAEDVTGMPMMMQGQESGSTPATLGGQVMQQNNASTVLRRIARLFDDNITEPHIRRYYEFLMQYGEDESAKGDFVIDARGSAALVERDLQNMAIAQMGNMVANPAFGIDPEKWFAEMCKAQRLDPKRFTMDEQKKAQLAQQPPPKAPQVEVAEIRAQTELQKTEMVVGASVQKMQMDTDRDAVYVQAQTERDITNAQAKMAELQLKRELAMLEYANNNKVTLEKIKADLAKKAMDINATKELVALEARASQLPTPPVEPPGTAPAGQSFTQ